MGLGIRETFVGVVFVCPFLCSFKYSNGVRMCNIFSLSVDGRGGKDEVFKNVNFWAGGVFFVGLAVSFVISY